MPVEIRVPQLGESIVEATINRWLKKPGDLVSAGEAVVELATDKINLEVEAEKSGILQSTAHQEGDTVNIGDVLGIIDESVTGVTATAKPEAAKQANGNRNGDAVKTLEMPAATPVARRLADDNSLDLRLVAGSGPGGRIGKEDVEAYLATKSAPAVAVTAVPPPDPPVQTAQPRPTVSANAPIKTADSSARPEERIPMSRRRLTIASRLVEAQHTAAMLTTFNEVDMSAIMAVRARRKDAFKERHGVGLGFMSFFTRSVIGALKAFPLLNAEIQGTDIVKKLYYDIGIAVGAEEGLVVPVVRDADRKTFAQVEKEISDLAKRARENKLTLPDLQGGTFTITNGGVFGSLMSTPILNAPQVGILGMHKIQERPVVKAGEVVIAPMMYLALSYDHRIVDGSEAVRFLVRVKDLLEDPEALLLEA